MSKFVELDTTQFAMPDYVTPYNKLPIVIDAVGVYLTSEGDKVKVFKVGDTNAPKNTTRHDCKAIVYTERNGRVRTTFAIFHRSGKHGSDNRAKDIISKLTESE